MGGKGGLAASSGGMLGGAVGGQQNALRVWVYRLPGGSPVTTLYECAECKAVTNTVWSWGGRNLCRVCFGRERLGDYGSGGVQHSSSVTLVRGDGTSVELDTRGVPIESTVKQAIEAGDASTRKIRVARGE